MLVRFGPGGRTVGKQRCHIRALVDMNTLLFSYCVCMLCRNFLRLGDPLFCKYNEVVQSDEFIKVGGAMGAR